MRQNKKYMKLFFGNLLSRSFVQSSFGSILQYHHCSPRNSHYEPDNQSEFRFACVFYLVVIGGKTESIERYAGQYATDIKCRRVYCYSGTNEFKQKHYLFLAINSMRSVFGILPLTLSISSPSLKAIITGTPLILNSSR